MRFWSGIQQLPLARGQGRQDDLARRVARLLHGQRLDDGHIFDGPDQRNQQIQRTTLHISRASSAGPSSGMTA